MESVTRGLTRGEDGYEAWLRYATLEAKALRASFAGLLSHVHCAGNGATMSAIRAELQHALPALLQVEPNLEAASTTAATLIGTVTNLQGLLPTSLDVPDDPEGYGIFWSQEAPTKRLFVTSNTDVGVLYGVFALLRSLSMGVAPKQLAHASSPRLKLRMLNHWDNLDGTIERGFAGNSLWDWYKLPDIVSPRYVDYARLNASIGINAVALTNVNANALVLTHDYLLKVAAIADVFRPYGIRVFLTARFSAPIEIGGLPSADPALPEVHAFWQHKANEIYALVPDFGGFVVKANSEGQPGPQDYRRSHAEGANLLAKALAPHGGYVVWRAFVYSHEVPDDRAKQAFNEFVPLDGSFLPNVLVQVKNGPVDFQPREPIHPLFGALPKTPVMMEFQLTQEYLGNSTHLVYLGPLFEEVLQEPTWQDTSNPANEARVADVVDGTLHSQPLTGMTAVANIGNDANWCGHPFAASNWYVFGRLCWEPRANVEALAKEWVSQTFTREPNSVDRLTALMIRSREAVVRYMTPLGLHHIMAHNHHQGPGPWVDHCRADWTSTYYHRADLHGVGFDRTETGSDALAQYSVMFQAKYRDQRTCPLSFLLWFHRIKWTQTLPTGRTLWQELATQYQAGVDDVRFMKDEWAKVLPAVDPARHHHVNVLLARQEREAVWWKDACLTYFQSFHDLPLPSNVEAPEHDVAHYRAIEHYFVPGIPERRR